MDTKSFLSQTLIQNKRTLGGRSRGYLVSYKKAIFFWGIYCHPIPDSRRTTRTHCHLQAGRFYTNTFSGSHFSPHITSAHASFLGLWPTSGTQGCLLSLEMSCPSYDHHESPLGVTAAHLAITAITIPFASACGVREQYQLQRRILTLFSSGKPQHFLPCGSRVLSLYTPHCGQWCYTEMR